MSRYTAKCCQSCANNTKIGCLILSEEPNVNSTIIDCPFYNGSYEKVLQGLKEARQYSQSKGISKKALKKLDDNIKWIQEEYNKSIKQCYEEDKHRGSGGGNSNDSCSNRAIKQLMKDNRIKETKWSSKEREEYNNALKDWEEKNGQLPKYQPNDGITRRKEDSYIEDVE